MGRSIVQASYMQSSIQSMLKKAYSSGKTERADFRWSLDNMGMEKRYKWLATLAYPPYFIYNMLWGNEAEALHGSLNYTITVEPPSFPAGAKPWTPGVARVRIEAQDGLSAISGTRLPPIMGGYSDSRALFTKDNPFRVKGPFRTIRVTYDVNIDMPFNPIEDSIRDATSLLPPTIFPGPVPPLWPPRNFQ